MNFFIYGARRSGKTTKLEEIVSMFPDLPIVADMSYEKVNYLPAAIRRRVKSRELGLRNYIRICEDIDTVKGEIKLEGTHVILTATPDNHKENINTRAYSLFECAVSHGWAIIWCKTPKNVEYDKAYIPEHSHLGTLEGNWYTEKMLEAEKRDELAWRYEQL